MLNSSPGRLLLGLAMGLAGAVSAAQSPAMLEHNPFNKPATLAVPPPQQERIKQDPVAEVMPRLSAILVSDSLPLVIVDNEILSLGEVINGFRLVSINHDRAVFEKLDKSYTLMLDDDDKDTASQRQ